MKDSRNREIDYLRLSVTDRCNLRCVYCMPSEGVSLVPRDRVLSVEETVRLTDIVTSALGITKVRITGGEPLVRGGVTDIIRGISSLGVPELVLTTNGVLLEAMAEELAGAGIQRVNVSLDSLRDSRLRRIAGRDMELARVEAGIAAAARAGMSPVKVNCVVMRGWNDDEIPDFLRWGERMGLTVRFIEHMPSRMVEDVLVPRDEILERAGFLGTVERQENGGSTAGRYMIRGTGIIFGIIAPLSDGMCRKCSRVRLSAEGTLYPCLSVDAGTPLRELLRSGSEVETIAEGARRAVFDKPVSHGGCFQTKMWKVGG